METRVSCAVGCGVAGAKLGEGDAAGEAGGAEGTGVGFAVAGGGESVAPEEGQGVSPGGVDEAAPSCSCLGGISCGVSAGVVGKAVPSCACLSGMRGVSAVGIGVASAEAVGDDDKLGSSSASASGAQAMKTRRKASNRLPWNCIRCMVQTTLLACMVMLCE